jgi:hypothetical protein
VVFGPCHKDNVALVTKDCLVYVLYLYLYPNLSLNLYLNLNLYPYMYLFLNMFNLLFANNIIYFIL